MTLNKKGIPDQRGTSPLKLHPNREILNDLQARLTRWLQPIDDPVLRIETIFNNAKRDSKGRWKK